jgi:hypothetical protein
MANPPKTQGEKDKGRMVACGVPREFVVDMFRILTMFQKQQSST